MQELKGKRVGLLMNAASRVDGTHMLDTLLQLGVNVTALFAPEHGFRTQAGAGEQISNSRDEKTGLPIYSLYGQVKKPTQEMLKEVDLILTDLPDLGLRFYTYNSTVGRVMEAAFEFNKEVWILDRPVPLGGEYVAGWVLRDKYTSFVGSYPVPAVYGMSLGEIMDMAIGEAWIEHTDEAKYKVIEATGWDRSELWPDTKLDWVAPSPNLPTFEHVYAYAGTVIFEATNLSEGRGTEDPFLQIGSPTLEINNDALQALAKKHKVKLERITFTPRSIPGKADSPKHEGQECTGIRISFNGNYRATDPLKLGVDLLLYTKMNDPEFEINSFANKLFGINLQQLIENEESLPSWEGEVQEFKVKRAPYLRY